MSFLSATLYPLDKFRYCSPSDGSPVDLTSLPGGTGDELEVFAQWLSAYGPRTVEEIAKAALLPVEKIDKWIDELAEDKRVVIGALIADHTEECVCDADTYEVLLRMTRARRRKDIDPLEPEHLQQFLARRMDVGSGGLGVSKVLSRLEILFFYPAPAGLWESDILPARLKQYDPSWLDSVLLEQGVGWVGTGRRRLAFYYPSDRDLLDEPEEPESPGAQNEIAHDERESTADDHLLPGPTGAFDFSHLLRHTKLRADELTSVLWDAAWEGRISNDTFSAVRKGLHTSFRSIPSNHSQPFQPNRRLARGGYRRKTSTTLPGRWYYVPTNEAERGIIEIEERRKDRVRILLDRYGVLFRSLLKRELPDFQWSSVFRALRIMELSGEVVAGMFFRGIAGLQFASPDALQQLGREENKSERVYWMNAADPASICGLDLSDLPYDLPPRNDRTHLVFEGTRLVLVSRRLGKELNFFTPHDHSGIDEYPRFLHHLITGPSATVRRIPVEKINGKFAGDSPYLEVLRRQFDLTSEPNRVMLFPKLNSY